VLREHHPGGRFLLVRSRLEANASKLSRARSIFSFVAQQIFDTGTVPASDVGFWSGLIVRPSARRTGQFDRSAQESLFSLTQVCVMLPAGWLSDRIGRKPCLVGSLACLALGQVAYGFSTSVYMMVATRCISGIFASSAVNVRTMIVSSHVLVIESSS
jgi:MFS family permease